MTRDGILWPMRSSSRLDQMGMSIVLAFFLTLQLTGLTCIQDLGVYSIGMNSPASISSFTGDSSTNAAPQSSASWPKSASHDCPCHYMVNYISGFTLASVPYIGELALPISTPALDNLPQVIFHPPLTTL